MSRLRLGFILILAALFVGGLFGLNKFVHNESGDSANGDSGTIRGVVATLLPSGKVIVVRREDESEVLLSLTDASTITDELGEDLFYNDVKTGMQLSAAGIRGVKDNVLIPSLVTVSLQYANQGVLHAKNTSFDDRYFSVHYNEALWKTGADKGTLQYKSISGCLLEVGGTEPSHVVGWARVATERKLGGNVFQDARYTENGEQRLRVLSLDDPGEKYGAQGESLGGPYQFVIQYKTPLSGIPLAECTKAVDDVVSTFVLRNATENTLLIEPSVPLRVQTGEAFTLRGVSHAFDGTLHVAIVDEGGTKVYSDIIAVHPRDTSKFGSFRTDIKVPTSAESRLHLKLFQYSPGTGSLADILELPLTAE